MRLLAQREHSRQELLLKLALKGHSAGVVRPVLDELATEGWQSDLRYAETYARQRVAKGYGWQRVVYELRQRGVDAVDWDSLKRDLEVTDLVALQHVYNSKFGADKHVSRTEWAKRTRFLLQRGFSASMIKLLSQELQLLIR